eukprot:958104-Prorocentrum_minimum.AAC.1
MNASVMNAASYAVVDLAQTLAVLASIRQEQLSTFVLISFCGRWCARARAFVRARRRKGSTNRAGVSAEYSATQPIAPAYRQNIPQPSQSRR